MRCAITHNRTWSAPCRAQPLDVRRSHGAPTASALASSPPRSAISARSPSSLWRSPRLSSAVRRERLLGEPRRRRPIAAPERDARLGRPAVGERSPSRSRISARRTWRAASSTRPSSASEHARFRWAEIAIGASAARSAAPSALER